jgi:hypothetical protein
MLRNIVTLVNHVLHASLQNLEMKHHWENVVGAPLERVCLDIFDPLWIKVHTLLQIFWTENFPLDQNVSA